MPARQGQVLKHDCDVVIVGAGVAGLTAAAILGRAGKDVRCLEATDRIGGRIWTIHDPHAAVPIELGAEFVHGRPEEVWSLIRSANLTAYEHSSQALHIRRGRIVAKGEVGEIAEQVLAQMATSRRVKDESFEKYLAHSHQPADVKRWARIHVEGFNAARADLISAASLKQDMEAQEEIEGDRAFRILQGYDSIPTILLHSIPDYSSVVQLNSPVERVNWRPGFIAIKTRNMTLRCRHVILTVPLGILQATAPGRGLIQFDPEPAAVLKAARALKFGQVYRTTLRFRDAFWEDDEKLKKLGFLVSDDAQFFTGWTTHPLIAPLLTAWCAGSAAENFQGMSRAAIVTAAVHSIERILRRKIPKPEEIFFHDWSADPFFRGAYSYAPEGALRVRSLLARPVEGTLFFAGEAAESKGHSGTVHGAIASGVRAARTLLRHSARED